MSKHFARRCVMSRLWRKRRRQKASSDALELEGLCDRVIVMSRGHAVATLDGDEVTEERIVHAAISATTHTAEQAARKPSGRSRLARFIEGEGPEGSPGP